RPRPLPRRPLLGRARPPPPARQAGQGAAPRPGAAAGGGQRGPGRGAARAPGRRVRDRGGHLRRVGPRVVRGLRAAAAFLTRVPVTPEEATGDADLARSLPWFPVVGALV